MEFLDDDTTRPRFVFQSSSSSSSSSTPQTLIQTPKLPFTLCLLSSLLLLLSAFHLSSSHTLSFLLAWLSLSLLLGPFAPLPLTAGHVSVGLGDPLPDPPEPQPDLDPPVSRRRSRLPRPRSDPDPAPIPRSEEKKEKKREGLEEPKVVVEETEWTDEDVDLLKKTIAKHPVGTPRRWEVVAEVFEGRHGVESVVRMAKGLGERRPGKDAAFTTFLKQRKAVDERVVEAMADSNGGPEGSWSGDCKDGGSWSSGEDIALLNALKAFPKDTPMRWEKIEAAVPGRSKASCVKRVAVLKKDFRSSKAVSEA